MRDFLKGCRYMAGIVSLVMVCSLMLLWVRSRVIVDTAMFSIGLRTVVILSKPDQLTFVAYFNGSGSDWQIESMSIRDFDNGKFDRAVEEMRRHNPGTIAAHIPYWLPTASLVALSTYFLFHKPRNEKSSDQAAISNVNLN